MTILGPDTVTAVNEIVRLTVETEPFRDQLPVYWERPFVFIRDSGRSTFFMVPAGAFGGRYEVTALVGPHRGTRAIEVRQKLARTSFLRCSSPPCVAYLDDPPPSPRQVALRHVDANGHVMLKLEDVPDSAIASLISRDPAIIAIDHEASSRQFLALEPNAQGATYLVSTRFGADSLLVYADWAEQSLAVTCPGTLSVGAGVQLAASVLGQGGVPLVRPVAVEWSIDNGTQGMGTLTFDGFLTGVESGQLIVHASTNQNSASCAIDVVP